MDGNRKSVLYACGAIGFWSTVATAFKIALEYVSYLQLLALSSFFSLTILLFLLLIQGRISTLFSFTFREYLRSALLGLFNPFLYYLALFIAYSRLLGQQALVLNYTWPITLVVFSTVIFRKPLTARMVSALVLSFIGIILVAVRKVDDIVSFADPLGVVLAVGSSFIWSLFWIFNIKDPREETVKLCLNSFFGFIYAPLTVIFTGHLVMPQPLGILPTVYIGFFEMGLTFYLWLHALKLTRHTAFISNLVFLSPFFSLFLLHFIIGESLSIVTFVGLILIIGGILIQRLSPKTSR